MSEIDQYKHECIGIVLCPSSYPIVAGREHRNIPLYRIDESAEDWHAKAGDLLLGGGSGESSTLRISIPEAIHFGTQAGWNDWDNLNDIYHAYWSLNDAYIFGEGYSKLGWSPDVQPKDIWLMGHILAFVLREYPDVYGPFIDLELHIDEDGSICRLPTPEEKRAW